MRTYEEFRDQARAEALARKLARLTVSSPDPVLRVAIGDSSKNAAAITALAMDCQCDLDLRLVVTTESSKRVLPRLAGVSSIKILDSSVVDAKFPNFMVSGAGYYLQNGLTFDEAKVSFEQDDVRDFLLDLFESMTTKEIIAA